MRTVTQVMAAPVDSDHRTSFWPFTELWAGFVLSDRQIKDERLKRMKAYPHIPVLASCTLTHAHPPVWEVLITLKSKCSTPPEVIAPATRYCHTCDPPQPF